MLATRALRRPLAALTGLLLSGTGLAVIPQVLAPTAAHAAPTGYVTLSDGTSIAINVRMPTNYVAGQKYPPYRVHDQARAGTEPFNASRLA